MLVNVYCDETGKLVSERMPFDEIFGDDDGEREAALEQLRSVEWQRRHLAGARPECLAACMVGGGAAPLYRVEIVE